MTSDICYFDQDKSDLWVEMNNYRYEDYNYRLCLRKSSSDTYDVYLTDDDILNLIDSLKFSTSLDITNDIDKNNIIYYRIRNIVHKYFLPKFLQMKLSINCNNGSVTINPKFFMNYGKIGIFNRELLDKTITLDLLEIPRINSELKNMYNISYNCSMG